MRRSHLTRCVLLSLCVLCCSGLGQAQTFPAQGADAGQPFTVVDQGVTFVNPSFGAVPNGVAHQQDMLVSHAGWQYLAYWDEDRRLTVSRRPLAGAQWETLAFEDYRILGEDSHNSAEIGICPNDGTIHLAFDHHVDDLNYRVSIPGVATTPGAFVWDASLFGPIVDTLDPVHGTVTELTYPRFLTTPSGDLQMFYREITSGNGRSRQVDYDGASGTWSNDHVFIERTGNHSDPLGGSSTARNPYFNRIAYDDQGTLHATWTWRERATIRYNRDIAYAFSEDDGVTWRNGAGEKIADTSIGQSIVASTPGINGITLGAEWGLMNDQGHVVDGRGRVHVVMYHKDEPDDQVSYGNVFNSHYNHYWLDADGIWRSSRLSTIGNRPKLFADRDGNLLLAYKAAGVGVSNRLAIDVATPEADYLDWRTVKILDFTFSTSAQADHGWFDRSGMLSIAMQRPPSFAGESSDLGVADLHIAFDRSGRKRDLESSTRLELAVERDTFVRGGVHAGERYGSAVGLSVQDAFSEDDQRLSFVRFHLAEILDRGRIARATLRLAVASQSGGWTAEDLSVRRCALDSWPEYTTDWNNRPIPDGPSSSSIDSGGFVDVDVTDAIALELANGGGRITFELAGLSEASNDWIVFHAREAGANVAARLLVEQVNTLEPVADTYVRSGIYSSTNYGVVDKLVVKEDGLEDYDRVAYLRFDVAALAGTGDIERVFLRARGAGMSSLAKTTPYFAHAVADDAWDESAVTWDTRPVLGAELSAHFGRRDMQWDVTAEVLAALTGDGMMSIGLRSDREGGARALNLWSREASNVDARPRLVVRYAR